MNANAAQMLDAVAEVEKGAYAKYAELYSAECDRLAIEMKDATMVDYMAACQAAANRIAQNMFALAFA